MKNCRTSLFTLCNVFCRCVRTLVIPSVHQNCPESDIFLAFWYLLSILIVDKFFFRCARAPLFSLTGNSLWQLSSYPLMLEILGLLSRWFIYDKKQSTCGPNLHWLPTVLKGRWKPNPGEFGYRLCFLNLAVRRTDGLIAKKKAKFF